MAISKNYKSTDVKMQRNQTSSRYITKKENFVFFLYSHIKKKKPLKRQNTSKKKHESFFNSLVDNIVLRIAFTAYFIMCS